jgi:hypothetical protein
LARRCFDPARETFAVSHRYCSKQEETPMNQIQEKDWAEESWYSHTGIDSSCDYCIIDKPVGKAEESVAKKKYGESSRHKEGVRSFLGKHLSNWSSAVLIPGRPL